MTTDHIASDTAASRAPLTRDRVLGAAVALADRDGIDAVSMRKVGQELGVEAMSLYNHVENKEDMLNGMVDVIVSEIDVGEGGSDWQSTMRSRILSARAVLARHPWAPAIIESRTTMTATVIGYMDSVVGIFRQGGFSLDLTHHAMHALGSRLLGFSQELFDDSEELAESPEVAAVLMKQMLDTYPNISAMLEEISHDSDSVVGSGCDDEVEFIFALDLMLDGLERLRQREALPDG